MAIAREELKHLYFRDVATGKRLAPVHPGDVLMRDFIEPMGITRWLEKHRFTKHVLHLGNLDAQSRRSVGWEYSRLYLHHVE